MPVQSSSSKDTDSRDESESASVKREEPGSPELLHGVLDSGNFRKQGSYMRSWKVCALSACFRPTTVF